MVEEPTPPTSIDTSVPHSARIWNYWLGGKDNYEPDRKAGDAYKKQFPGIEDFARASRAWLARGVHTLTTELGIRQFLDVGAGLPTDHNTHQVAQGIAPQARVVYVDHDPMVLLHVQALLDSTPEGATDYIQADMVDTETIVAGASRTLDFTKPIGLVFSDVLGHVEDLDRAVALVQRLVDQLAPGSYLMISHATTTDPRHVAAQEAYNASGAIPYILRPPEEIRRFFDGLDLIDPGLARWADWRPDAVTPTISESGGAGGVGGIARIS